MTMKNGFSVRSVKDFGARGDKSANECSAIQKAIDTCHKAGGGTVCIPPGDYLSGTIFMKSNVTLYIEAGATLWGSVDEKDYTHAMEKWKSLIAGNDLHDMAIIGRGKINGQGFEKVSLGLVARRGPPFRPRMVYLSSCRNVLLKDITIEYASSWTVHLFRCDNVNIRGISILNQRARLNTDGIDIDCSRNVHISDCHIAAGDDCIVLKTTSREYPCENVTVTNCTLETSCAALKLGTESFNDFRNCTFSNCVIRNTTAGIMIIIHDGGTVENIAFSNITIENLRVAGSPVGEYPIIMTVDKRFPESKMGRVRNIVIRNLMVDTRGRCFIEGGSLGGVHPIENLTLEDIHLNILGYEDSSTIIKPRADRHISKVTATTKYDKIPAYFVLAYLTDLTVHNLHLTFRSKEYPEKRFIIYGDHIHGFELNGFRVGQNAPMELPILQLDECRDILVRGCRPPSGTGTFLSLGDNTTGVVLAGNDFSRVRRVLEKAPNVQDEDVCMEANRMPR